MQTEQVLENGAVRKIVILDNNDTDRHYCAWIACEIETGEIIADGATSDEMWTDLENNGIEKYVGLSCSNDC